MKKLLAITTLSLTLLLPFSYTEAKSVKSISSPTALCKDGTYSYSANHKGTCSHHRGVKVWYK